MRVIKILLFSNTDFKVCVRNEQKEELINRLSKYEKETMHQIIILTIPNLRGEGMEKYISDELAKKIIQTDFVPLLKRKNILKVSKQDSNH